MTPITLNPSPKYQYPIVGVRKTTGAIHSVNDLLMASLYGALVGTTTGGIFAATSTVFATPQQKKKYPTYYKSLLKTSLLLGLSVGIVTYVGAAALS